MVIVKHLDRAKKLTVPLKASVNFLSFWESMWVCRKVPQSKNTSVLRKVKEVKKTIIPKSGSQPPNYMFSFSPILWPVGNIVPV